MRNFIEQNHHDYLKSQVLPYACRISPTTNHKSPIKSCLYTPTVPMEVTWDSAGSLFLCAEEEIRHPCLIGKTLPRLRSNDPLHCPQMSLTVPFPLEPTPYCFTPTRTFSGTSGPSSLVIDQPCVPPHCSSNLPDLVHDINLVSEYDGTFGT